MTASDRWQERYEKLVDSVADEPIGRVVVPCPDCGQERWHGYGPCSNCGAPGTAT